MAIAEVQVRIQDGDEFAALLAAIAEWRMARIEHAEYDEHTAAARIEVAHDDLLRAYNQEG